MPDFIKECFYILVYTVTRLFLYFPKGVLLLNSKGRFVSMREPAKHNACFLFLVIRCICILRDRMFSRGKLFFFVIPNRRL